MRTVDWIGWAAALILFANLSRQVWTQWKEDHCDRISPWVVMGEAATAAGFLLYSWLLGPRVFVLSMTLLVIAMAAQLVFSRMKSLRTRYRGGHQRSTRLA